MIGFLRKNFPATVTSETVKKFSLASNNESYVINALQFIGVLDEEGKRTSKGHDIFVLGDDAFPKGFEPLIREAYKDLFETRGDEAWTLSRKDLIAYFRATDKTSDVIGARQAGVFQMFSGLAGHQVVEQKAASSTSAKPKAKAAKASTKPSTQKKASEPIVVSPEIPATDKGGHKDMALTVRIEINLPANGSQETYDNIFKSIRANLIDA
jgi:hypothetical protein